MMMRTAAIVVILSIALAFCAVRVLAEETAKDPVPAAGTCKMSSTDLDAAIKTLEDVKVGLTDAQKDLATKVDAALKTLKAAKLTQTAAPAAETYTGPVNGTHTRKVPRITVDGNRYNLIAADGADAAVKDTLAKIGTGDLTGEYVVKGKRQAGGADPTILVSEITKK